MRTKIVEVTNHDHGGINYGRFLLAQHTADEWTRRALIVGESVPELADRSLLGGLGTDPHAIWVLDLVTREGASFSPRGCARADLDKHRIWVCPMFEPFLEWLYAHPQHHANVTTIPDVVTFDAPSALSGYRRAGT